MYLTLHHFPENVIAKAADGAGHHVFEGDRTCMVSFWLPKACARAMGRPPRDGTLKHLLVFGNARCLRFTQLCSPLPLH